MFSPGSPGPGAAPGGGHPALSPAQFKGGEGTPTPNAPNSPGTMTPGAVSSLWDKMGGPPDAAANMGKIAMAESSGIPSNTQQGQPPGTTGHGLFQVTPTSGILQGGEFGNLNNAANNTLAAIDVFKDQGYHAFTDPVGLSLPSGPGK